MNAVEKVTAFVTRRAGRELLLFQHPNAGIQIPAGTVEAGEEPRAAALREVHEETGLTDVVVRAYIGCLDQDPVAGTHMVARKTRVYARPDAGSFDWAEFRRGITVTALREASGFVQVEYTEWDRVPDSQYVTYHIVGWMPADALADRVRRHFFHLAAPDDAPGGAPPGGPESWTQSADQHVFRLFWAPLADLPQIIDPQPRWLEYVVHELGYDFRKA